MNPHQDEHLQRTASWRQKLLLMAGPSLLGGIRMGDWLHLLRDNDFRIDPRCSLRAASISLCSIFNSIVSRYESVRFRKQIEKSKVEPPLFILGHWRSGTTYLHNLLSLDPQFASPTLYEVLFPHTFLTTERLFSKLLGVMLPRTRPADNVKIQFDAPYEDEIAMCISTLKSKNLDVIFPQRASYYGRFLDLRELSEQERDAWKVAFVHLLRKLSFVNQKPLLLKSPPHTARIRIHLELFPEARFVHIHRNPYEVFQSTRKQMFVSYSQQHLQRQDPLDFDDIILSTYKRMYETFFEERPDIPEGHFCEVGFEQLEADPVNELSRIYSTLNLTGFDQVLPKLNTYVESAKSYHKNKHQPLPPELRERIHREWKQSFDEWGYSAE